MKLTESRLRTLIREELSKLTEDRYSDETIGYRQGEKINPRKLRVGKVVKNPKGARGSVDERHVEAMKKRLQRVIDQTDDLSNPNRQGNIPGAIVYTGDGNGKWIFLNAEPGDYRVKMKYRLPEEMSYTDEQIIRGDTLDEVAEKAAAWGYIKSHAGGNYYTFEKKGMYGGV